MLRARDGQKFSSLAVALVGRAVCAVGMVAGAFLASSPAQAQELRLPAALEPEPAATSDLETLAKRLAETEKSLAELTEKNDELSQELEDNQKAFEEFKEAETESQWYDKLGLRGYAQIRYNYPLHLEDGSAPPQHASDSSIAPDQEFLIRRARLIVYGDVDEHLYVYLQPDFASTPNGSVDAINFAQIRDWYGDIYLDTTKVHRFRVGQSKIPYGWENLQSSSNRLPLDRADSFNSAARNERDLGVFYYFTPEWAQDTFKMLTDEGLKGSGNYGVFGFGAYDGQGGSLREQNDNLHIISRLALPFTLPNCQVVEVGIQGYTGLYEVLGAPIAPLGVGPAVAPLGTRGRPTTDAGFVDKRLGWTFVYYPQPFGVQAEYTIGEGPELNEAQTAIGVASLKGGYVMLYYRHQYGEESELWPFIRWSTYEGGYKTSPNAPSADIAELSFGFEWQFRKEVELVTEYMVTDRTNLLAQSTGLSYGQFDGDVLRFQLQFSY